MRLNRFLAAAGLGSRRSCEELILNGSVTINGQVCQSLARDVGDEDFVKVGGKRVVPEKPVYILLHKPRGYLCTASDTHDRRTIFDLLPGSWPRLFHVGRLDLDSEGLLILTNDGDLALRLTHPRYKIEKEYEVLLDRPYDAMRDTPKLLKGVSTEHGRAKADLVRQLSPMLLRIVLRQGLKRQIRLMLYKVGYEVKRLIRTRIGTLRMGELRAGEWRNLTEAEVKALRTERRTEEEEAQKPQARPQKKKVKPDGDGERSRRREKPQPDKRRGVPAGKFSGRRSGSFSSAPKAGRRP
jgi:23S rRNA pseudouridine2605 synthase